MGYRATFTANGGAVKFSTRPYKSIQNAWDALARRLDRETGRSLGHFPGMIHGDVHGILCVPRAGGMADIQEIE